MLVREELDEAVGGRAHRDRVEAPRPLIGAKPVWIAEIEAKPRTARHPLGKRRGIAQPEIEPLACDRVDHMRRIADERQAPADEVARHPEAQRIGDDGPFERELAEFMAEAPRDLLAKMLVAETEKTRRLLLLLGPDDRAASAFEGQRRERPARQEMLKGASLMVALMRDGRGEAALRIAPADPADASALAAEGARPVGCDQEPCFDQPV